MGVHNKRYSAEFKQDAVNSYHSSGKSFNEVSKDLKASKSSLCKWVNAAEINNGKVNHRGSSNYSSDVKREIGRFKKKLKDSKNIFVFEKTLIT